MHYRYCYIPLQGLELIVVSVEKALFYFKYGPLPPYGDGEVELGDKELVVRLPMLLAEKLKKGISRGLIAKTAVLVGLFGPSRWIQGKSDKISIPYSTILDARIVNLRYGIFGRKEFIEVTIGDKKGTMKLCFAPFKGLIKRDFRRTKEFYDELLKLIGKKS